MGFDKHTKDVYTDAKKALIEEYFYGDESLWKTRSEPFIHFKHLFRQIVHHNLISNVSQHARFEGVDHTTIRNSLEATTNLHPKLKQSTEEFILERLTQDQQTKIKVTLNKHRKKGYTQDDIARNYQVHEDVIRKVLEGEYVAQHTLNYIYRQL